tara:strand:+ start:3739 stop:4875 length:1137 start_codon:yes stop_codon:yes gene_type:complete
MDKYSRALLADAKQEYTSQLISVLVEPIYEGIASMYAAAQHISKRSRDSFNVLKVFQKLLSQTPTWDGDKIHAEFERIKKISKCDYMDNLITAVFVAHAKILTSIRLEKSAAMDLNIPKGSFLIHNVYIEVARNFWKRPYLMHSEYSSLDLQRNLIEAEALIKECILETIRKLLPVRDVLNKFLNLEPNNLNNIDDDIVSTVSDSTKKNVRSLLEYEMNKTRIKHIDTDFSLISIGGNSDDEGAREADTSTVIEDMHDEINIEADTLDTAPRALEQVAADNYTDDRDGGDIQVNPPSATASVVDNDLIDIKQALVDLSKNIKLDNLNSAEQEDTPGVETSDVLSAAKFDNRTRDEISVYGEQSDEEEDGVLFGDASAF